MTSKIKRESPQPGPSRRAQPRDFDTDSDSDNSRHLQIGPFVPPPMPASKKRKFIQQARKSFLASYVEFENHSSEEDVPKTQASHRQIQRSQKGMRTQTQSQTPRARTQSSNSRKAPIVNVSDDELKESVLHYVLIRHSPSTVFLRKELIREPLKGLRDKFMDVFIEVNQILEEVFLMKLVPLQDSDGSKKSDFFILVGKIPFPVLACGNNEGTSTSLAQKYLQTVLVTIFMTGKPMEIDGLWDVMTELEFQEQLCPEIERFPKFLKQEYVNKHYLQLREYMQTACVQRKPTYEWGTRSLYEFSKLRMLQSVAEKFGYRDLKVFAHAYSDARKHADTYGHKEELDKLERLEVTLPPVDESLAVTDEAAYVNSLLQSMAMKSKGESNRSSRRRR